VNARVVPLDAPDHDVVLALLPWFVAGTLAQAEAGRVRAHLADCARCRAQCDWERRFARSYARLDATPSAVRAADAFVDGTDGAAAAGLAALAPRLAPNGARARHRAWVRRVAAALVPRRTGAAWLGWAVAVPGVAILAIAVLLARVPTPPPAYRALAAPGHDAGANAIVIFGPGVTELDIRRALSAAHARVVDGPTAAGAWALRVPDGPRGADAIATLRADPAIATVERLQPETGP